MRMPAPPPTRPSGVSRGLTALWDAAAAYLAEGQRLAAARRGGPAGVPVSRPAKGFASPKKTS